MSDSMMNLPGGSPLIGAAGGDFVGKTLANAEIPTQAIREIQAKCAMQNPQCGPLLGLVQQMGISKASAHHAVLDAAKAALLARIPNLDRIRLERLLNASFLYLSIAELRDIPKAVMEQLEKVPAIFLKQLAADPAVFSELPTKVQRQVWECDKNLLQHDALPLVGQYKYEAPMLQRALALDEFLPHTPTIAKNETTKEQPDAPIRSPIARKVLRRNSHVLQDLKVMVGDSYKIYTQIVELCIAQFRDSDASVPGLMEASYCTLRSQLLMALHDDSSPIPERDRVRPLCWTLDAGMAVGRLSDKHHGKLREYFAEIERTESASGRSGRGHAARAGPDDEAESAGCLSVAVVEPYRVLGDVGMVLRDPSAFHLLLMEVLSLVSECVVNRTLPRDNLHLPLILRMLALALSCRNMLRERRFYLPRDDPSLVGAALPVLAGYMADFVLSGNQPVPLESVPQNMTSGLASDVASRFQSVLSASELARRLLYPFTLHRLARGDALSAVRCLRHIANLYHSRLLPEMTDFLFCLAKHLIEAFKPPAVAASGEAAASDQALHECLAWRVAVEEVLLKAVDAHPQVHLEVLRLLLAVAPRLPPAQLASYVSSTLDATKQSRKRTRAQAAAAAERDQEEAEGRRGDASAADAAAVNSAADLEHAVALQTRIGQLYQELGRVPGLGPEEAPALHASLGREW